MEHCSPRQLPKSDWEIFDKVLSEKNVPRQVMIYPERYMDQYNVKRRKFIFEKKDWQSWVRFDTIISRNMKYGYIYVIRGEGYSKIGISGRHPSYGRLLNLQSGCPMELSVFIAKRVERTNRPRLISNRPTAWDRYLPEIPKGYATYTLASHYRNNTGPFAPEALRSQ